MQQVGCSGLQGPLIGREGLQCDVGIFDGMCGAVQCPDSRDRFPARQGARFFRHCRGSALRQKGLLYLKTGGNWGVSLGRYTRYQYWMVPPPQKNREQHSAQPRGGFLPQKVNKYVPPEVPTGILTQP